MGIHGLTKLLSDEAPNCMKEVPVKSLTGRKVAIDASMCMYQFLVAVRSGGDGQAAQMLTNDAGEVTSHIQGLFNRTNKLLSEGVKPVYVFDGRPPSLKGGELAKRLAKRSKARDDLKTAEEAGNTEDIDKFSKRLVKVTKQHNDDAKTLLRLMGVPVVEALSEAEAQCAELARAGLVYATATEDMDALTFATPKLIRRMAAAANITQPVLEVDHTKMLNELGLSQEQFVDLCILCGCDYTDSIRGIGPKKALNFIRQLGSIENLLKKLDRTKYIVPAAWDDKQLKRLADEELARQQGAAARKARIAAEQKKQAEKAAEDVAAAAAEESAAVDVSASPADGSTEKMAEVADEADAEATVAAASGHVKSTDEEEAENAGEKEKEIEKEDEVEEKGDVVRPGASEPEKQQGDGDKEESAGSAGEAAAAAPAAAKMDVVDVDDSEDEQEGGGVAGAAANGQDSNGGGGAASAEEPPELIPMYQEARRIFMEPEVYPASNFDLKWTEPDENGLTEFLVGRMQFNADRVATGIKKLKDSRKLTSQKRMDSFFKVMDPPPGQASGGVKRKQPEPAKGAKGKGKGKEPATKKGKAAGGKKK